MPTGKDDPGARFRVTLTEPESSNAMGSSQVTTVLEEMPAVAMMSPGHPLIIGGVLSEAAVLNKPKRYNVRWTGSMI